MTFKPIKVIAFTLIVLAWILMTFFFVGCANVSYKTIPSGMSEDAKNLHFGKGTREAAMSKSFERCTRSQRGIVRISIYISVIAVKKI